MQNQITGFVFALQKQNKKVVDVQHSFSKKKKHKFKFLVWSLYDN